MKRKASHYVPQPGDWLAKGLGGSSLEEIEDDFPIYQGIDDHGTPFAVAEFAASRDFNAWG